MRTPILTTLLTVGCFLVMQGCNGLTTTAVEKEPIGGNPDAMFMTQIAYGSTAEIELSEVAAQRTRNDQVRQFARQMLQDHRRANHDLSRIAQDRGVTLPTGPSDLTALQREHLEDISPEQFDQKYLGLIIAGHAEMLSTLENAARTSRDSQIRQFAAREAPVVREHLEQAEQLNREVLRAQGLDAPPSVLPQGGAQPGTRPTHQHQQPQTQTQTQPRRDPAVFEPANQ